MIHKKAFPPSLSPDIMILSVSNKSKAPAPIMESRRPLMNLRPANAPLCRPRLPPPAHFIIPPSDSVLVIIPSSPFINPNSQTSLLANSQRPNIFLLPLSSPKRPCSFEPPIFLPILLCKSHRFRSLNTSPPVIHFSLIISRPRVT